MYKNAYKQAQEILSILSVITKNNKSQEELEPQNQHKNNSFSNADEIAKFLKLKKEGVITSEEFEKKKKELLDL